MMDIITGRAPPPVLIRCLRSDGMVHSRLQASQGLAPPTATIPFWLAYGLASIVDFLVVAIYFAGGHKLRIDFTRYVVAATAQDYYFNTDLAKRELGDWKTVRR